MLLDHGLDSRGVSNLQKFISKSVGDVLVYSSELGVAGATMRNGISVLGRKAFQFYILVLVGLFCYLHYRRYRISDSNEVIFAPESASKSSGRDLFSQPGDGHLRFIGDQGLLHHQHHVPAPKRFIFSLNYWEQFTMATVNLLSLVCLGSRWNATTVQPYTFNSRLYGLRNFKPGM